MWRITLSAAALKDLPDVMALASATPEAPAWTETMYRGYVKPETDAVCPKTLLVARGDGRLFGLVAGTVIAGEAELENITVAEGARRSGIGSALLEALLRWAREQGAGSMGLEV